MGLDDHDVAPLERLATDTAEDIIQALAPTAHEQTPHRLRLLIKRGPRQRGHGQDDVAIDDALWQHLADLADPGIDVDLGTAQAQRLFTAHGDAMLPLATMQTPILDIPHPLRIATGEHLVHEAIIVGCIVARIDVCKLIPVLDKDLLETFQSCEGAASMRAPRVGVWGCGRGSFVPRLTNSVHPLIGLPRGTLTHLSHSVTKGTSGQPQNANPCTIEIFSATSRIHFTRTAHVR